MVDTYTETLTMDVMTKRGRKPKHLVLDATGRSGTPVSLRIDPELSAALQAYIAAQVVPPTKTAVLEKALRDFLAAHGFAPGQV